MNHAVISSDGATAPAITSDHEPMASCITTYGWSTSPIPRLFSIGQTYSDERLRECVQHFNTHRPHRYLNQRPPTGNAPPRSSADIRVLRRDRLGGLVHEYLQVA